MQPLYGLRSTMVTSAYAATKNAKIWGLNVGLEE